MNPFLASVLANAIGGCAAGLAVALICLGSKKACYAIIRRSTSRLPKGTDAERATEELEGIARELRIAERAELAVHLLLRSGALRREIAERAQQTVPAFPDLIAPRAGRERLVAILRPELWPYWEKPLFRTVEQQLALVDCYFVRGQHFNSPHLFVREFEKLYSQSPAGIIAVPPPGGPIVRAWEQSTRGLKIPLLLVDEKLGDFPFVGPDDRGGADATMKALLEGGPSIVVLVEGSTNVSSEVARAKGYANAFQKYAHRGCRLVRVALRRVPMTGEQFFGLPNLDKAIRELSTSETVAFVGDCPGRASAIFAAVRQVKGEWPRRWQLVQFDALDEGNLLAHRNEGCGLERIGGCKVDRVETGCQVSELFLELMHRPFDFQGTDIRIPARPMLVD